MVGKPAPEIEATDLETGRPVRLADFRGKVVVLEFWGARPWSGLSELAYLGALHREYAGRPLEVVAIHDRSIRSRVEYDREVALARERLWEGHDLPFRVRLDGPDPADPDDRGCPGAGATASRYRTEGAPATFVIAPDGTLAGRTPFHDRERLGAMVREQVEAAEAR